MKTAAALAVVFENFMLARKITARS